MDIRRVYICKSIINVLWNPEDLLQHFKSCSTAKSKPACLSSIHLPTYIILCLMCGKNISALVRILLKKAKSAPNAPIHPETKRIFPPFIDPPPQPLNHQEKWVARCTICFNAFLAKLECLKAF